MSEITNVLVVPHFDRGTQTTWLIDELYEREEDGSYKYDAIKLTWVFSIIENDEIFPISLYIRHSPSSFNNILKTKMSFSSLKSKYANRGYSKEDCEKRILLKNAYNVFSKIKIEHIEKYCEFEKAIQFNAQGSLEHDSCGYGRSNSYYITGMCVETPFKIN